jgi:hypothetical protein
METCTRLVSVFELFVAVAVLQLHSTEANANVKKSFHFNLIYFWKSVVQSAICYSYNAFYKRVIVFSNWADIGRFGSLYDFIFSEYLLYLLKNMIHSINYNQLCIWFWFLVILLRPH